MKVLAGTGSAGTLARLGSKLMNKISLVVISCAAASVALGGCASLSRAAGGGKNRPDEFRVLTKAPLVVPPEYNLLPPRPGEAGPNDLKASQRARQAMLGQPSDSGAALSAGEQALIDQAARGRNLDPTVRAKLDAETAQLTTKSKSFADRILFWRGRGKNKVDNTPLDADAEADRIHREELIKEATGGGKVVIRKGGRIRLPGL